MNIIRQIEDVDFMQWPDNENEYGIDAKDNIFINLHPTRGTVIYVTGLVEGDDDSLMCLGAPKGSTDFRVALYAPFLEFEKGWYRLIGQPHKAHEIEQTEEWSRRMVEERNGVEE